MCWKKALEPDGHLIMAAYAIGGPETCSGLDVVQYDREKLAAALVEECSEIHTPPANRQREFTYFRFVRG
jgi:hypothetical protein